MNTGHSSKTADRLFSNKGKELIIKPLQSGITLSITIAVFYSLCTVVETTLPDQFLGFMNALFHGLNFNELVTDEPDKWPSYIYALVVLAVWGFAIGAFFAWLYNFISGLRMHSTVQHEQR